MVGDTSSIDRNLYLSSPLSIQVVAPRLQERRLYDAMQVVDDAVHGRQVSAKL